MSKKGTIPWNKGLTAATDGRVARGAKKQKGKKKNRILSGPQTLEMKLIKDSGIYELSCCECGEIMKYKRWDSYRIARRRNNLKCGSCRNKGRIMSDVARKNMSAAALNRTIDPEMEEQRRNGIRCGITETWANMTSEERIIRGKQISKGKLNMLDDKKELERKRKSDARKAEMFRNGTNDRFVPSWNSAACKLIDDYSKKTKRNFRHAENHPNGEFYIRRVSGGRFYADGYDEENNVWLEVDESYHKKQIDVDIERQKEIIEQLGCKFIRLKI